MTDPKKMILVRVYLVYAAVLLFAMIVVYKIGRIQLVFGDELKSKAEQQEIRVFRIEALRGNILATDGTLLATTVPVFEVRMDVATPHITDQRFYNALDSLATGLAQVLGDKSKTQYYNELSQARAKGNRYLLLKNRVTYSEVKALRKLPLLNMGKFKGGLILIPETRRERPYKDLALRTIGYELERENLFVGIEGAYHNYLKGYDGKQVKRRINNGDWMPLFDENMVEPQNGKDVVCTIDVNIQDVAQQALRRNLEENQASQGCAILMEVQTGHIIAIANLSLNTKTGKYEERINLAIAESVEPGSTFKLASMLVLLDDNKVKPSDPVYIGNGQMQFHNRIMKDVHPIRDGHTNVREIFEKSSNVGIAKLIWNNYSSKPERYIDRLYDLGINAPLGIEIMGEGKPKIKHPSNKQYWYGTSLAWMSIGYELQMTPLQVLTLYNAVANNGRMVKPLFVKEIRQGNTVIEKHDPVVIKERIASQATIDTLRRLLEGVVERGTGKALNNNAYKVAGKTGTAQIADKNKGYDKQNYNASFVGFFPADDPKYSCIVVVSRPKAGKIYGGAVAAPVFREIADKVYATRPNLHDASSLSEEEITMAAVVPSGRKFYHEEAARLLEMLRVPVVRPSATTEWVSMAPNGKLIEMTPVSDTILQNRMPDLSGMHLRDALYLAEKRGLQPKVIGKGIVRAQSVPAGDTIREGQMVELQLSGL
ncbi:MAG TPA: penicillin-binding transpeptidase domain-containing protein [Bacteroidales bacterium]|nr:penicillin-binding transpeptidase domain-containing protein [Bacteroidales bacterium]